MRPEAETIPALLALHARTIGAQQAIVADTEAVTYAELDDATTALAARFVAAGVVKGDRVGLLAPNSVDWVATAFAASRIGAVLVPLSTLLRPPELLAQATTASVTHLIVVPEFRKRRYLDDVEAAAPGLAAALAAGGRHAAAPSLRRVWRLDDLPAAAAPTALVRALEARVHPADDMVVLFTSGSTGSPKGIVHTHGGGLRAAGAGLEARCIHPGERVYIPMPFFWAGGFGSGLVSMLVAGATLVTETRPEPAQTLELLRRERVTLYRDWPDQVARLVASPAFADADLSSLGDGSLPALLPADRRPEPGARPNTFGTTESFGPYSGDRLDLDMPPEKWGSCGRPFEGADVRIADPDTGAERPRGELGQIRLRGPNVMRGICGQLRSAVFTADGFYPTGDRGRLDADGYLWFGGRLDDMFKVKGATVFPSEVEAALRGLDAVTQAFVVDVPGADGRPEVGAAVVTAASVEDVRAAVKVGLSAFKVPTRWFLTPDPNAVPVKDTGKIDKPALRELLVERGERT